MASHFVLVPFQLTNNAQISYPRLQGRKPPLCAPRFWHHQNYDGHVLNRLFAIIPKDRQAFYPMPAHPLMLVLIADYHAITLNVPSQNNAHRKMDLPREKYVYSHSHKAYLSLFPNIVGLKQTFLRHSRLKTFSRITHH